MKESVLILKPGREKSVRQRHPWIFTGAVDSVRGEPAMGETVTIQSASGEFLARAAYSPKSQIAARIWSWDSIEEIHPDFFRGRIGRAIEGRSALTQTTNAIRWVNAESDGLPGLIVDRYADFVVAQFLSAGTEKWKKEITATLATQSDVKGVFERSDAESREKEGLAPGVGLLSGEPPPELIEIWEKGSPDSRHSQGIWRFDVDVRKGHKTGFYLDQRENRKIVAGLAQGREVLNAFAYTGAFSVAAWDGGAKEVLSVDSSGPCLELAGKNLELNSVPEKGVIEADVFKIMRQFRDENRRFDMVILDPPKFAQSKQQIEKAARAYKDINWLAFRLLRPGGFLVSFSCSGVVSEDLFQKILFGATLDAGVDAQLIQRLSQATDHPVRLTFPEGAYLKGLVCRVE